MFNLSSQQFTTPKPVFGKGMGAVSGGILNQPYVSKMPNKPGSGMGTIQKMPYKIGSGLGKVTPLGNG